MAIDKPRIHHLSTQLLVSNCTSYCSSIKPQRSKDLLINNVARKLLHMVAEMFHVIKMFRVVKMFHVVKMIHVVKMFHVISSGRIISR